MKNRIWIRVICFLGLATGGATAQHRVTTDGWGRVVDFKIDPNAPGVTTSIVSMDPATGEERVVAELPPHQKYVVQQRVGRVGTSKAVSRTSAPGARDGFQRQTWTAGTYGHVDSLTTPELTVTEPSSIATDKYRYEQVPGSSANYQYTWNSSFDAGSVQMPTTQPTVKYQWPDGSVTEERLNSTTISDGSLAATTYQSGSAATVDAPVSQTEYRWAGGEPVVTTAPGQPAQPAATVQPRLAYESYQPLRRTHIQRTEWDAFSSRLSLKARFSFNVNTDFRSRNPNDTGAAAGAGNRFYDNGFVANDANTADTATWFYRYDNNPAFPAVGGQNPVVNQLFFHSVSSPADGQVRGDNDVLPGVELAYEEIFGSRRVIGELPWGFGLIAGISFANVDHRNAEGLSGTAAILEDRYTTVGGGPPNGPGVQGTFNNPPAGGFALLNDGPVRQPGFTSPATGTLLNDLNGQLYAMEIGPLLEIPITETISAVLAGGFGMILADLEYAFDEAFTLAAPQNGSPGTIARSGSTSEATLLMGGFARLNLRYQFDDRWGAEIGLQYQNLGDTDRVVGGKSATLVLEHVFSVNGGVSYAF